jgi:hypothetical protein
MHSKVKEEYHNLRLEHIRICNELSELKRANARSNMFAEQQLEEENNRFVTKMRAARTITTTITTAAPNTVKKVSAKKTPFKKTLRPVGKKNQENEESEQGELQKVRLAFLRAPKKPLLTPVIL